RKIVRSAPSACSRARTDPCRPILKATFVKGKMTTSRIGTIGYQATSAGARSEYSSIILRERISWLLQEGRAAQTAVSPLIRCAIVNHFPSVRHFGKQSDKLQFVVRGNGTSLERSRQTEVYRTV